MKSILSHTLSEKQKGLLGVITLTLASIVIALGLASYLPASSLLQEPCLKSTLCAGLLEVYEFEDPSDSARYGKLMGRLDEKEGSNIGSATGKTNGTTTDLALDLAGTTSSYLYANGGGGLSATTGFWLYADTFPAVGQAMSIISRRDTARKGPDIYLQTVTGASDNQLCIAFWSVDGEVSNVNCTADLATATWYYFVVGIAPKKNADGVMVGVGSYISQNGAAKSVGSAIPFDIHQGSWQVRIGNGNAGAGPNGSGANAYDGRLDQLAFWGRELADAEITLMYNGGNRLPYPFTAVGE